MPRYHPVPAQRPRDPGLSARLAETAEQEEAAEVAEPGPEAQAARAAVLVDGYYCSHRAMSSRFRLVWRSEGLEKAH